MRRQKSFVFSLPRVLSCMEERLMQLVIALVAVLRSFNMYLYWYWDWKKSNLYIPITTSPVTLAVLNNSRSQTHPQKGKDLLKSMINSSFLPRWSLLCKRRDLSLGFHSLCPGHNLLLVFCPEEEYNFNTLRWHRDRELCIVKVFTCLLFWNATASIHTNLQKNTPNSQIADLASQATVKRDSHLRYVEERSKKRRGSIHHLRKSNIFWKSRES